MVTKFLNNIFPNFKVHVSQFAPSFRMLTKEGPKTYKVFKFVKWQYDKLSFFKEGIAYEYKFIEISNGLPVKLSYSDFTTFCPFCTNNF